MQISTSKIGRCQRCGAGNLQLFIITHSEYDEETGLWNINGELKCSSCNAQYYGTLKGVSLYFEGDNND